VPQGRSAKWREFQAGYLQSCPELGVLVGQQTSSGTAFNEDVPLTSKQIMTLPWASAPKLGGMMTEIWSGSPPASPERCRHWPGLRGDGWCRKLDCAELDDEWLWSSAEVVEGLPLLR
jgi:hypothetical protein